MAVDPDKLATYIKTLEEAVQKLLEIRQIQQEDFFKDTDLLSAAKEQLGAAIEGSYNISSHIVAGLSLGYMSEYGPVFIILRETGILPDVVSIKLVKMRELREELRSGKETDIASIYRRIQEDTAVFADFISTIKNFMKKFSKN